MSGNIKKFYGKCVVTGKNDFSVCEQYIIPKNVLNNNILLSPYNKLALSLELVPYFIKYYITFDTRYNKIIKYKNMNCVVLKIIAVNNIKEINKYNGKSVIVLLGSLYFLKYHFLKFQTQYIYSPFNNNTADTYLKYNFSRINKLTNDGYPVEKDGDIIMLGTL